MGTEEKTVVLKFSAFSNISYRYEYDTMLTREEWNELSDEDQQAIYNEAIWNDIDYFTTTEPDGDVDE